MVPAQNSIARLRRISRRLGVAALGAAAVLPFTPAVAEAAPLPSVVAVASSGTSGGLVLRSDGAVTGFGRLRGLGGIQVESGRTPAGITSTPDLKGYWVVTRQGRVFPFGDARFYGSGRRSFRSGVVAIASSTDGKGYWILRSDGQVAAFGDASYFGGSRPVAASRPAVSITPTRDGKGYFIARAGGGVYTFGDARWHGGAIHLHQQSFIGLDVTPSGNGYWLVESNGRVVPFGDARTGVRASRLQVAGLVPLSNSAYTLVSRTGLLRVVGVKLPSSGSGSPSPTPSLPGSPMKAIFDDEFNGSSLSSTWSTCWWYSLGGCSNGDGEGEWYTPQNVSVGNGSLNLRAGDTPVVGKLMSTGAPRTYQYTSGMVTSYKKFSFTYGYVEWRAEIPAGQGLWPALWMMPENNSWPPEIDALETVGNQPNIGNFTYHTPAGASDGFYKVIPGLSSGFHTFGVDWEPGSITWYVDGQKVASTTDDVTSDAMYLVMNLAVGGAWPGYPNATTAFPSAMKIDYVRVWQHS